MHVYQHFPYTGVEQRWAVPEGVTEALFECWGGAGALPSSLAFEGKKREVVGGDGPKNNAFYGNPYHAGQLGTSFANNAGYAAGVRTVADGEVYYVYVGGNGQPGHSTIKLQKDGSTYTVTLRGGAGGWNGGGDGGKGAHVYQNLYDSTSTKVHYKRSSLPPSAKSGQLWHDTSANLVKKCNHTYTSGPQASYWDTVTHSHSHAVGPSGGGGGGATDIRLGGNATSNRILVAGGGGGAGGLWNKTGKAAWALRKVPATPAPPFGSDTSGTGATGPDNTWATAVNYFVGGWGGGGLGGATGPTPNTSPTPDGGYATGAGSGGPATARHQDGVAPTEVHASGGNGGGPLSGGGRGNGGSGASGGTSGQGGSGADADGGVDDWCAGGGGGGGGYFGGGGGGQGFKVSGHNSGIHTRGGGGGGGSNYVAPSFSAYLLAGAAQPPYALSNKGTGANGLGGFARISYRLAPNVDWASAPNAVEGGTDFDVTFDYSPAADTGPGISYYVVGTAADPSATFPTSESTYMVSDSTLTEFTHTFTAPAAGVQSAYFVKVVDTDGDASAWLKQKVTGLSSAAVTPATITSPALDAQVLSPVTVDWTVGTQTPLVAYRLGVTGSEVADGSGHAVTAESGWRRGGSRVNLALDPGFEGSAVWSSTSNTALTSSASHPGISGASGHIAWTYADDFSAENHTTTLDNLLPGTTYRLHLEVASGLANDPRLIEVQVWDNTGMLTSQTVDLSGLAAGAYAALDLEFTPQAQGVYFAVLPSASGVLGDALYSGDFEAGTVDGWTAATGFTVAVDGTQTYQGSYALHVHGHNTSAPVGASKDVTSLLPGAGAYVAVCQVYQPTFAGANPVLYVTGSGVSGEGPLGGTTTTRDAFAPLRVPFTWDGTGSVVVEVGGDSGSVDGDIWYDLIEVYAADASGTEPSFGNADSAQDTYLANMLIEVKYEEDSAGYGAYFDGAHLNGNPGAVSWSGTANASPSILTDTDVLTGSLTFDLGPLSGGSLYLDTLASGGVVLGSDPVRRSEDVMLNPSLPAIPNVTLAVDNTNGLMTLTIDANDGSATYPTVSFDIYRNDVRIVTGLTPDVTTRRATYSDVPASGETAVYTVRAWDAAGGYADQGTGTVN